MKDPCSGSIAVATVVLLLLVKFAALAELSSHTAALLWVSVLGRAVVPLLLTTPYVRPNGGLGRKPASSFRLAGLFPCAVLFGISSLALGLCWPGRSQALGCGG